LLLLQVCEALHNHVKHLFPADYTRRAAVINAEETAQGYGSFPVDDVEYSNKQASIFVDLSAHITCDMDDEAL